MSKRHPYNITWKQQVHVHNENNWWHSPPDTGQHSRPGWWEYLSPAWHVTRSHVTVTRRDESWHSDADGRCAAACMGTLRLRRSYHACGHRSRSHHESSRLEPLELTAHLGLGTFCMIWKSLSSPLNIWIVNASVGCNVGKKKIDCFIPVSAGGWCGDEIYNRLFMLYISSR